jgi:hypothetical protein
MSKAFVRGTLIERALEVSISAHAGQKDKQGMPYILHPLRVMVRVQAVFGINEIALAVAVLHDVPEDTSITLSWIRSEFGDQVANGIDSVTKRNGENYITFVRRSAKHPIGKVVKLADIEDNRNRIPTKLESKWWNKINLKYTVALNILKAEDGDQEAEDWLEENAELVAGMENS